MWNRKILGNLFLTTPPPRGSPLRMSPPTAVAPGAPWPSNCVTQDPLGSRGGKHRGFCMARISSGTQLPHPTTSNHTRRTKTDPTSVPCSTKTNRTLRPRPTKANPTVFIENEPKAAPRSTDSKRTPLSTPIAESTVSKTLTPLRGVLRYSFL